MSLAKNIRYLRKKKGLTQNQVADILGYKSFTTIQKWEMGISEPSLEKLSQLAKMFNVEIEALIERDFTNTKSYNKVAEEPAPYGNNNIHPNNLDRNVARIKVIGKIPAGLPIEAIEEVYDWEEIPVKWLNGGKQFIGLKVEGDSMYPKYMQGDTVIIQIQSDCESGDDCAVFVNGYDVTLKKIKKDLNNITLEPLNPNYAPATYQSTDDKIKILGKVVELRRKI